MASEVETSRINDMLMMLKDVENVMSIDLFPTGRAREKFRERFSPVSLIVRPKNTFHENKKRFFCAGDNWGTGESLAREIPQKVFGNLPSSRKSHFGEAITTEEMKELCWLKPKLVAQTAFTEWTHYRLLRHAIFHGLRDDKKPREVVREILRCCSARRPDGVTVAMVDIILFSSRSRHRLRRPVSARYRGIGGVRRRQSCQG